MNDRDHGDEDDSRSFLQMHLKHPTRWESGHAPWLSKGNGTALCGYTYPGWSLTTVVALVTCSRCRAVVNAIADGFVRESTQTTFGGFR